MANRAESLQMLTTDVEVKKESIATFLGASIIFFVAYQSLTTIENQSITNTRIMIMDNGSIFIFPNKNTKKNLPVKKNDAFVCCEFYPLLADPGPRSVHYFGEKKISPPPTG